MWSSPYTTSYSCLGVSADSLAALLQTLADEQRSQREIQNMLLAEQADQVEAQTLLFQELRQQQ